MATSHSPDMPPHCTQIYNWPMRNCVYRPDVLRYKVTDLIWLRYHAQLAEFGYSEYLIVPFCYASAAYQTSLVSPCILTRLRLAKIRTMARPNSAEMLPAKRTKKVRSGVSKLY